MSCTSCSTSKSNADNASGGCGQTGGCSTGSCNKLNVFDWLSDISDDQAKGFDTVEIRFKGGRKEFFQNIHGLELHTGDPVIVETGSGLDLGFVSLQGELVRLQIRKKKVLSTSEILPIVRIASLNDREKYEQVKEKELPALYKTRQIILDLKLQMKLSDVEFQWDLKKATYYYSAEDRVDFRELIKLLATEFKIRIEMKQISLRQEAGRLGGIGVCGRELCCSTWLTDFKSVSTSAARYQNLSLNPTKLSGQCGRLKCCLNYELDTYVEAVKDIPQISAPIKTEKGDAYLQKTDIFRKLMWFSYKDESEWQVLNVQEVQELLILNLKGIKPNTLNALDLGQKLKPEIAPRINRDLEALDNKYKDKTFKNKRNKKRP